MASIKDNSNKITENSIESMENNDTNVGSSEHSIKSNQDINDEIADTKSGTSESLNSSFDFPSSSSGAPENALVSINGPLPRPRTARRLKFGPEVEAIRRQITERRQTCNTRAEYNQLFTQIDKWIAQAVRNNENTIAIRLLLDKSVVAHFGLQFDKAITLSKEALEKTNSLESPDEIFQLQLVAKFVQCSIYSRQAKYGKAWSMLQGIKQQIKDSGNSEDHWRLHYNMGTNRLAFLKASNDEHDITSDEGVRQFELSRNAISDGESRNQMYDIQDHFFALVMAAKLLLKLPEHKSKRLNQISHENIAKAQGYLELVLTDYSVLKMPVRFKLRLLITMAGLYYRLAQRNDSDKSYAAARVYFMEALLFLEGASLMCKDSPYEEREIITDLLEYLKNEADFNFLHHGVDSKRESGERNESHSETDSELIGATKETYSSESSGKLGRISKVHKRRSKTTRTNETILTLEYSDTDSVTSSDSISSEFTDSESHSMNQCYGLDQSVLMKIMKNRKSEISSEQTSESDSLSGSGSFASSASAEEFRTKRDMIPPEKNSATRETFDQLRNFADMESSLRHNDSTLTETECMELLVNAKTALDFGDTDDEINKSASLSSGDLKLAYQHITQVKQYMPFNNSVDLQTEILFLSALYYLRTSQLAANDQLVSTCRFALNMAILYMQFAHISAGKLDKLDTKEKISWLKSYLEQ